MKGSPAQEAQPAGNHAAVAGAPGKPATRMIDEMTSREVEFYLKEGGDLVFVPFGPVSGHGAFIPMGIHGHWATALSLLTAEKADAWSSPPLSLFSPAPRAHSGVQSLSRWGSKSLF
ncbi:MAG: hypothetical protein JXQ83_14400 [Candidatus Glassbacteria bacterium]|nr:hypothetical protein [Candidatus Glassbacteria bacterium]